MNTIIQFIFDHAQHAHWLIFGALMLAGFNIPISEDLVVIFSAILAATIIPKNTVLLFLSVFLGCYISDWICYWIGRIFGHKLWKSPWFAKTFDKNRIDHIQCYYEKYGFWTLLIGRFIPFGVRNCLFLTAGLGRMHFGKFLLGDGIACIFSNTLLFSLTYMVGKNYQMLLSYLKIFNIFLFGGFMFAIICYFWYKRKKNTAT